MNTIGIVSVAALAAIPETFPPAAAMTLLTAALQVNSFAAEV